MRLEGECLRGVVVQDSGEPVDDGSPALVSRRDFDAFYAAEFSRVLGTVFALSRSWSVAEEITQESFLRALRRWTEVGAMARPDAWVRRVACNAATSRFRRRAAELRALARLRGSSGRDDEVASPVLSERDEGFWRLVSGLPPRQAVAVALHYGDDLAITDVAEVMEVAEGTVKAHLHAARAALQAHLAETGLEQHDGR